MERRTAAGANERDEIAATVERARAAGSRLAERDADATARIVEAVGEALSGHETVGRLALAAATETGRGHPGSKAEKVATALDGSLAASREAATVGAVDRGDSGGALTVAHPVGVVGAAVPATHPVVVPAAVSLYALAGRNAVVLAPSPSAVETCDVVVERICRALDDAGAPTDAAATLSAPPSKPQTDSLFERVDRVVAAGSEATVAAGQRCGTPNACASADDLVAVADTDADPSAVAARVAAGATYDFGAHPAADAAVVTATAVVDELVAGLEDEGGYVLDAAERGRLRDLLDAEGGPPERAAGNSPRWFAAELDLPPAGRRAAFVVVDEFDGADDPLATLPGIPAVAVHEREGFGACLRLAAELGGSHAAAVHTTRHGRVRRAAERLRPGRLVVNRPGTEAVGTRRNEFRFAPILGDGTADGSQLSGGLSPTDLIETTAASTTGASGRDPRLDGAGGTLRGP